MSSIIQIKYKDIPVYLKAGEFYRSLEKEDPDDILDISVDSFHANGNYVANLAEFSLLLRTTMFWMLDEIPLGVMQFCAQTDLRVWHNELWNLPHADESGILLALFTAFGDPNHTDIGKVMKTGRGELLKHSVPFLDKNGNATSSAAANGNLPLLRHLHEEGFDWDRTTCSAASKGGHLQCLEYARENGCAWNEEVHVLAAQNGHVPCIKYAHYEGLPWHPQVCAQAARFGQLHCLVYAHEHGCPWDKNTTNGAAEAGYWDCLQFALCNGCPHEENASCLASENGNIDCLKLLHQHSNPWSVTTSYYAAECPDETCLQYLHENGCPWDGDTPTMSVKRGCVNPLRYALVAGCAHSIYLLQDASLTGSLECIQYLVEDHLMAMDELIFLHALLRGNLQCVHYLLDQGCPMYEEFSDSDYEYCNGVFRRSNPEFVLCLELAMERGWEPNQYFIEYLYENDYTNCRSLMSREGWIDFIEIATPISVTTVEDKDSKSAVTPTPRVPRKLTPPRIMLKKMKRLFVK